MEFGPAHLQAFGDVLADRGLTHREKSFVLSSGEVSHWYFDHRRAVCDGGMLRLLGHVLFTKVQITGLDFDVIAAEGLGAEPVKTALGFQYIGVDIAPSMVTVNLKPGLESDQGPVRVGVLGANVNGLVCLPVEDTVTTSGSVMRSIHTLRGEGGTVTDVLGVVDRSNGLAQENLSRVGVNFHSILTFDESEGRLVPTM